MLGIGWKDGVATIVDRRLVDKKTEPDMGSSPGRGSKSSSSSPTCRRTMAALISGPRSRNPSTRSPSSRPTIGQRVKVKLHAKDQKVKFDRERRRYLSARAGRARLAPSSGSAEGGRQGGGRRRPHRRGAGAVGSPAEPSARLGAGGPAPTEPVAEVELGPGGMSAQNEARVKPSGAHLSMAELVELKKRSTGARSPRPSSRPGERRRFGPGGQLSAMVGVARFIPGS